MVDWLTLDVSVYKIKILYSEGNIKIFIMCVCPINKVHSTIKPNQFSYLESLSPLIAMSDALSLDVHPDLI